MGCFDKVGGTIIALFVIGMGISSWTISVIIAGVVFGILTHAVDEELYFSFFDSLDASPFSMLMAKFFFNGVISGIAGYVLHLIFGI